MKKSMYRILSVLAAFVMTFAVFAGAGFTSEAAKKTSTPVLMTTTMDCSVWSAPSTAEANRVKKIPAGYQVTVYPDVVQSSAGDGKTFFKTVKGAYILCKCFAGEETPSVSMAYTPENIYNVLISFQAKYPEGTYYTDDTNYWKWGKNIYNVGGYSGMYGTGCVAFAMELSDAVFGENKVTEYYDMAYIRVGDIIRINNDRHSVIVLQIKSDGSYVLAESNYNSSVHWFRTFSSSEMAKRFCYGWTRY